MKNTGICPKCGSGRIARIPDNGKYANGNSIYLRSTVALLGRIPVIQYVCCDCGYVEEWVEAKRDQERIAERFERTNRGVNRKRTV